MVSTMFSGLMSRWAMWFLRRKSTAFSIWSSTWLVNYSDLRRWFISVPSLAYSISRNTWYSSSKLQYNCTILGCSKLLWILSSFSNCSYIRYPSIVDFKIFFIANSIPVFLCRHIITSPNFPDPTHLPNSKSLIDIPRPYTLFYFSELLIKLILSALPCFVFINLTPRSKYFVSFYFPTISLVFISIRIRFWLLPSFLYFKQRDPPFSSFSFSGLCCGIFCEKGTHASETGSSN